MNPEKERERLARHNESLVKMLATMTGRVEAAYRMLSAIAALTSIPTHSSNIKQAASEVLETLIMEAEDFEANSIMLFSAEENRLLMLAARGQADILGIQEGPYNDHLSFKPGEGIAGRVFADNLPFFWNHSDPRADWIKIGDGLSTPESLACLPLSFNSRPIGVLNISFGTPDPFDVPRKRSLIILSRVVSNILQTFALKEEVDRKTSSLLKARDELEKRVETRTAALVAATDSLKEKINERQLAERALAESEFRYRSIVEKTSDGFFVCELPSGRFQFLNQKMMDLFGYDDHQVWSKSFWDLIVPSDRHEAQQRVQAWLASDSWLKVPEGFTALRQDGSSFMAEVSSVTMTQEGQQVLHGVIRDVTEKNRLRHQMLQSQKLEAIGTLAGGIAHDFNNILSAMMGFAELALIHIPEGNRAFGHVSEVVQAGLRARDLVRQILAFSRRTEIEKKPLFLMPIIKEAVKLLRASLPATIDIRTDFISPESAVLANPAEINQLIMNLGANAGQAMRLKGGLMTVALRTRRFGAQDDRRPPELNPGTYAHLMVRDTGQGMDEAVLARIFEPYFTTRTKDEGTGLGLAVVHGIVKSHGGAITVSSKPERGTEFGVFFPVVEGEPEEQDNLPAALPRGNERILFVDDEQAVAEAAGEGLQHLGYRVTCKVSSLEALAVFKENPNRFDLVITDQTMPSLTGIELARRIMRIRPDIPIILCTGFSEQITEDDSRKHGIRLFLYKPWALREIAREIRMVLDEAGHEKPDELRSSEVSAKG